MRNPEKPPNDEETHKLLGQNNIKSFEELRPYLNIVNSKYLHWDELPMRFKDIKINLKLFMDIKEKCIATPLSINKSDSNTS